MTYLILLQVCCIGFITAAAQSQKGYIFTSPRTLNTGENNELHMKLYEIFDAVTLDVQVFYKKSYDSPNETLAVKQRFEIPAGEEDVILNLALRKLDSNVYEGRIQINGTYPNSDISGSDKVNIAIPKTSILIIQTDKPMYQPGQTVKFRILRTDKDLKPFKSKNKTEAYVQDPKGTRLFQFTNLDLSQGVVQKEFHLSDEPVEGGWSITATSNDDTETAYFDVKEYVLPKFDVKINFPPYVLADAESFPVEICAKYTYGKPVVGTLHLNASLEKYFFSSDDKFPTLKETVEIDGCYNYTVNVSLIEPDNQFTYRSIQVSAHVIEEGTGVERDATNSIRRETLPLKLEFKDQRGNFKFGLPFNGKLVVSYPDNTPAAGEPIEICEEVTETRIIADWSATKTYKMCNNFTSDDDGIILFYILAKNIDVTSIRLIAKSTKYISPTTREGRQNALSQPETSAYLTPFFSPSNSFIQIQPVQQPVPCGMKQNFEILFTAKGNENFKFYYQITRQADLVLVNTIEKEFSSDDDISKEFDNSPKLISSEPVYIVPSPKTISSLSSSEEDCPAAEKKQELPLVGKLKISIDIDTSLTPGFHLLIYYINEYRETVADSQEIKVEKCFKNKVDFHFGDAVQQPSLPTSIKIKASPNSLCGIRAVDKSITLLDNSNQLTADNVFQKLENLDDNQYYSSNICYDTTVQPGLENSAYKSIIIPPPGGYRASSYDDSLTAFQTSGFVVISNFLVFTRPCPTSDDLNPVPFPVSGPGGFARFSVENSLTSVKEVRDYFPETWLFEMKMIGIDGTFEVKEQLPDTITEWIGSAFCINSKDGLGISNDTSITAFQPFFIDYTLPVSVIRGEKFIIVVSVFNYDKSALPISVSLINPEGFEVTDNGIDGDYCLKPDESLNLPLTLKATKIGKVNITVKAESDESSNICGEYPTTSAYARDAVTKPIEVEAEGFPVENVINTLFCPSDYSSKVFNETIHLSVPKNIVPDSARAFMDITGNVMGPAINNLDSLVSLPTGCGEQNMVKFTPNYIVLDYLQSIGKLTDNIKNEAISNLNTGYQRELKFRHDDGSFSAFGEVDNQGSMFLTAFVLRSFYQAKRYIYIDDDLIKDMQKWILSRQNADGCFQDSGKIIDIGFEGGIDDDKSLGSITAYVLASLKLSNFNNQTILNGGFTCLENNPPKNPYSQLLYAYAYSLGGRSKNAQTYIDEARQRINKTGGMESFIITNGTKAIEIETDAYAVLATLTNGGSASDVLSYVRYLTNNLNPNGGFQSTQDTCVGLEALAKFGKIISKDSLSLKVTLSGGISKQVNINNKNKLVVQRFKVADVPTSVAVKAKGSGCGLIQSSIRYNTESPPEKNMFAINVKGECSFSSCQYATISVIVSYLPSGQKSGMSILEIKMITGYVPDKGSLDKLQSDGNNNILRIDVENNMVIFYFSELSNEPQNISFRIERVVEVKNPKPGTAKVYDYYANENSGSTTYTIEGLPSDNDETENDTE